MDKTVKYAIDIVNKWEEPLKNFEKQVKSISNKKVTDPFRDLPRSIAQLKQNLDRYKRSSEEAFSTDHIRKYKTLIEETERKIKHLEGATRNAAQSTDRWSEAIRKAGGAYMAYQALSVGKNAYWGNIQAAAQVEKYNVTLKTMLGSRGAARERMSQYSDIAQKTPFELNQVVEAGNQLQAIGRYSRTNLTMLGDLGAASGKPLEQVMGAYAKLSTGQKGEGVNMFRDLLISTDDWVKATGKGIAKNGELIATTEEMLKVLPKIMKSKGFFGMMDQQSKTTVGQISNLKDNIFGLSVAMGDRMKPSFDRFLSGTSGIVSSLKEWVEIPVAVKIAEEKAELNSLVGLITDVNTGEEQRKSLISELQQNYPEFLGNINAETASNKELQSQLAKVNKEYDTKIQHAGRKTVVEKLKSENETNRTEAERLGSMNFYANEVVKLNKWLRSNKNKIGSDEYAGKMAELTAYKQMISSNTTYDDLPMWSMGTMGLGKLFKSDLQAYDFIPGMYANSGNILNKKGKLDKDVKDKDRVIEKLSRGLIKDERTLLLEQAQGINIKDSTTFEKLFGDSKQKGAQSLSVEFDALRKKTFDVIKENEWERLGSFMSGDLKYRSSTTPGGTDFKALEKASDSITGGGKNVKQIIINLDSLINTNNNNFTSDQNPADSTSFMDKFTAALESIVNDVNYSAG